MSDNDTQRGLTVGELREALISAMDLGGAYGRDLPEAKAVLLQVGDQVWPLATVKVSVRDGSFVLVLEAAQDGRDSKITR